MVVMLATSLQRRIHAALWATAVGDALGNAAVGYWEERIAEQYGGPLSGFVTPVPASDQRSRWDYGEVTDDSITTQAVATSIAENGRVIRQDIARQLIALGPKYTRGAISKPKAANDVNYVATSGRGNGACGRVAPIGMIHRSDDLEQLVDDVFSVSTITHGTRSAVGAAVVTATLISGSLDGLSFPRLLERSFQALDLLDTYTLTEDECDLRDEIRTALRVGPQAFSRAAAKRGEWGFHASECVPLVIAVVQGVADCRQAILAAANLGGDADSTAALVGSITAARRPETLPDAWVREVDKHNRLSFTRLAPALSRLRECNEALATT